MDEDGPMGRILTTQADHSDPDATKHHDSSDLVIRLGHDELVLRQRYELISIANDVLAGILFLIGSFLFFSASTTYTATWLFVIGSVSMLLRPVIRLVRRIHLQKTGSGPSTQSTMDF